MTLDGKGYEFNKIFTLFSLSLSLLIFNFFLFLPISFFFFNGNLNLQLIKEDFKIWNKQ